MTEQQLIRFARTALSVAVAALAASAAHAQTAPAGDADKDTAAPRAQEDKVRLGTITIVGEGNKLGAGLILNEDAAKSRSTVTKAATEKDRATGNPYQALALLPGVNTFNYDATGLFGGVLTVRGFNSDQLGITINGVPVNDSGNFAVYPQEYADQENLCTQSVTQGSPDSESPHAGATGGNVTITACDPEDKRRVRVSQTVGGLNLTRSFVRFDSGRFADDKAKVFLSYSHTEADKWKGPGKAQKDHIDAAFRVDFDQDNTILGSVLYNRAINNNIATLSLAQLNQFGYYYDYSSTFPGHATPTKGTADKDTAPSPQYYGLSLNPFRNAIVSLSGSFKLAPDTYLKVQPYFWYGFGTGGNQQRLQSESSGFLNPVTHKNTGAVDLNGDGDTLDSVIVANSSVTRTLRPGVTTEVNTTLGDHQLRVGVWYERANHRQTGPMVPVDNNGNPVSVWLDQQQILRPNGTPFESRDLLTISTAYQGYITDAISFAGDRGLLTLGVRTPHVTRDVTNYANEGSGSAAAYDYHFKQNFDKVLPQAGLRFYLDKSSQVFANLAKNFKAPPNYSLMTPNVSLVNGVPQIVLDVKPETAIMADIGYRYQSRDVSLSATLFNSDWTDRQASTFDASTNSFNSLHNIGKVNNHGLEFEVGSGTFWGGFTAYGSLTLQKSKVKSDFPTQDSVTKLTTNLPTNGKEMTLTPQSMVGASLQYAVGPAYVRLKAKYTGKQYTTLMNDEEAPGYTVGDLDAGYNFGNVSLLSNMQLRASLSNIGNARYRISSSGTVTNATKYVSGSNTVNANTVFYYLGAPRLFTVSLSADF